jgi:hypothetical protein
MILRFVRMLKSKPVLNWDMGLSLRLPAGLQHPGIVNSLRPLGLLPTRFESEPKMGIRITYLTDFTPELFLEL